MRFDSIASLISFLGVLHDQGYAVPFRDYDKELKNNGFTRHIHNYKVIIETVDTDAIKITFYGDETTYVITATRRPL